MIAFISIGYAALYVLFFNKLVFLKQAVGNICAFAGVGVVLVGSIVVMWYTFSPMSADARTFRYIIPIVPNVKGQVVDVPVQANQPLSEVDLLFRIEPNPTSTQFVSSRPRSLSTRRSDGSRRRTLSELPGSSRHKRVLE